MNIIYSELVPQASGLGVADSAGHVIFVHASLRVQLGAEEHNIATHEFLHDALGPLWRDDPQLRAAIASTESQLENVDVPPAIQKLHGHWSLYFKKIFSFGLLCPFSTETIHFWKICRFKNASVTISTIYHQENLSTYAQQFLTFFARPSNQSHSSSHCLKSSTFIFVSCLSPMRPS